MSFCDHCEGQRLDRARVLRVLRQVRKDLRRSDRHAAAALDLALQSVKDLDIPHLDYEDEGEMIVH